jgi:hypothetical protein
MILTTQILEKYLGNPAATMLADAPFKDWKFEKSFENDLKKPRIDYIFPENGLDFVCDADDQVRTIFLYWDEHRRFEDGLADLPFSSTRQEVMERLGAPSKSGGIVNDPILGEFGPWDRFAKFGYSIHVEYKVNADSIKKITLMRADVVP